MICLDTNYLILGLVRGSPEARRILSWADAGERFCTASLVWYEFACGPADPDQIAAVRSLLDEILPFEGRHAEIAAHLFNVAGRSRRLRIDAMIAAVALLREVPLATRNHDDFAPFVGEGLRLTG